MSDTAASIMTKPVILSETSTVEEVARHLGAKGISAVLLISKDKQLSGIFTEKDFARHLKSKQDFVTKVSEVMTKDPVTIVPQATLEECAAKMQTTHCKHLPVLSGKNIVGIVEILNVQASIAATLKAHVQELQGAHAKIKQRDEYLGIVAHDIRSPLSVISICTEMLELLHSNQPLGYDEPELLARIKYNTERALALVHDLLDIGRLHAGAKLNFEQVKMPEYLEAIIENLRFYAREKDIQLISKVSDPIVARIDRGRYAEIVINLIHNGIKFSPRNSTVTIKSEFKRSPDPHTEGWLSVSIKDQGPGIPQDKMLEIFGKYKQLDSDSKSLGFGLGLSIANQFTRLHEGKIEVESKSEQGTTFTVTTPYAKLF